ncbi:hypothetical protein AALO_G00193330 [Alosa alosa]|uniref:Uncharacterized protein n=1 Tax=Alosa alosa TaxID=278164 RepID=A0AAV6G5T9_9TELE|nr:hypothetical protein AALO_G00193330 [Alosa alosa]
MVALSPWTGDLRSYLCYICFVFAFLCSVFFPPLLFSTPPLKRRGQRAKVKAPRGCPWHAPSIDAVSRADVRAGLGLAHDSVPCGCLAAQHTHLQTVQVVRLQTQLGLQQRRVCLITAPLCGHEGAELQSGADWDQKSALAYLAQAALKSVGHT